MPRLLSILMLAAPALCAQDAATGTKKNPVSLLPDGSVLKGVLLPRYDTDRNLVGDLQAETMILIDPEHVQGENVLIRFYNPDRTLRGKVALKNALFDQVKSRLSAKEAVEITNDRLVARGSGLVYAFQDGEGFLRGPANTWITAPPKTTSMNTSPFSSAALIALCFAPSPLIATPPPFVSKEEIAAIETEVKSTEPELAKRGRQTDEILAENVRNGDKATAAALAFVNTSGLDTAAAKEPETGEAKPLEIKPGPDDTQITCDGGMYFDADEGVLVYLKNVTVKDPRFDLKGASQLKVFFDKKPEAKKPGAEKPDGKAPEKPKAKKPGKGKPEGKEQAKSVDLGASFGDVKKIIAEGAVVFNQKSVDGKEPVQASGRVLTYDIPTGEIIIHGGYPWVKQGTYYARALEPNLTLRLLNTGSFSTEGNWQMGGVNLKGKQQ